MTEAVGIKLADIVEMINNAEDSSDDEDDNDETYKPKKAKSSSSSSNNPVKKDTKHVNRGRNFDRKMHGLIPLTALRVLSRKRCEKNVFASKYHVHEKLTSSLLPGNRLET